MQINFYNLKTLESHAADIKIYVDDNKINNHCIEYMNKRESYIKANQRKIL